MKIAVGIPTINRADLLKESLVDFAETFPDMDHLYIVDNGKQFIEVPQPLVKKSTIHRPESNLGVAGSWTHMAQQAFDAGMDYIFIVNDDIVCGHNRQLLEQVIIDSKYAYFINSGSWSIFLLSRECFQAIGPFDDKFFPAYYEDNDYSRRLTRFPRSGIVYHPDSRLKPKVFRKSMTIAKDSKLNSGTGKNKKLFNDKWGGPPGKEIFADPYNKVPPPKLHIVTRTSGRPNFFKVAYESIHAQAIPNMVHVVITDDIQNSEYVKNYRGIRLITLNRDFYWDKEGHSGTPYNEYLNVALNMMRPQDYICMMDDDDFYIDNHSLKEQWDARGEHDVVIWQTRAAGGTVPYPQYMQKKQVVRANIAMPGFMVKRETVGKIQFTSAGGGDFNFMNQVITQAKNVKWVSKVIPSVSSLAKQGKGQRKDAPSYEEAKRHATK